MSYCQHEWIVDCNDPLLYYWACKKCGFHEREEYEKVDGKYQHKRWLDRPISRNDLKLNKNDWSLRDDLSVLISRLIVENFEVTEKLEKNINTVSYVVADLLINSIEANK